MGCVRVRKKSVNSICTYFCTRLECRLKTALWRIQLLRVVLVERVDLIHRKNPFDISELLSPDLEQKNTRYIILWISDRVRGRMIFLLWNKLNSRFSSYVTPACEELLLLAIEAESQSLVSSPSSDCLSKISSVCDKGSSKPQASSKFAGPLGSPAGTLVAIVEEPASIRQLEINKMQARSAYKWLASIKSQTLNKQLAVVLTFLQSPYFPIHCRDSFLPSLLSDPFHRRPRHPPSVLLICSGLGEKNASSKLFTIYGIL